MNSICPTLKVLLETSSSEDCEVTLLLRPNHEQLKLCHIVYEPQTNTQITYIKEENGWLYSTVYPEQIRIECDQRPNKNIEIEGPEILRLTSDCRAQTKQAMLDPNKTKEIIKTYLYKPELTLNVTLIYPNEHKEEDIYNMFKELNTTSLT